MAAVAPLLPGVIFVLASEPGGRLAFRFVGERSAALLGLDRATLCRDPEALLGRMQTPARNSFLASLAAARAAEVPWQWEGQVLTSGAFRWIHIVAQPQLQPRRPDGVVLWYGLMTDTSAQHAQVRAMEQALADLRETLTREQLRSEALVSTRDQLLAGTQPPDPPPQSGTGPALQQLALGLAHEINNPLAGIIMMFERLRDPRSPPRDEACEVAIAADLLRIQQAVGGLLQYAQPPPPQMLPVTWHEVAGEAAAAAAPALLRKGQQLTLAVPRTASAAHGDRILLAKALINVLLNASQASPPNSCIALHGDDAPGRVAVHVHDRGPGIPREYLHRVCDPYFTTKQQGDGCGLGLATSSRIMAAHQGELLIESQEGHGTQVSLWLPAAS